MTKGLEGAFTGIYKCLSSSKDLTNSEAGRVGSLVGVWGPRVAPGPTLPGGPDFHRQEQGSPQPRVVVEYCE